MLNKDQKSFIDQSEDPAIKEMGNDIEKYGALEAIYVMEGGQQLVKGHIQDVVDIVDTLSTKYKTLSHIELIAYCADLKTKLDMVRSLAHSAQNKQGAMDALEEALKTAS